LPAGIAIGEAKPLFPTLDKEAEAALLERLVPKAEAEAAPATKPAAKPEEAPTTRALIDYETFARTELRVGLVLSAERVPKKDKLLLLKVDVGEAAPRTIVAGLALTFKPEDLVQKRVVVVANLAPRDFGKGLVSFGMLLAAGTPDALRLATAPEDVAPGALLK
jgi:methionine--tRNA ligase beta chain